MKPYLILSFLLELLKHDIVTAKNIAEKYEVSTRTIYRYINDLESAGVPTVTYPGKYGGIGIDTAYKLNTTYFTKQEKELIITSVKLMTYNCDKEILESIINKLSI